MGIRDRIRHLEMAADEHLMSVELEDGMVARFDEEAFTECFLHEYERGRRHHYGEEPGRPHPLVEALRQATNLDALVSEHGTMLLHFLGEDAIIRGEMERPGPPVRETGPGVYE